MFTIQSFTLGPVQTNAYVLTNKVTNEAIVIDPGMNPEPLLQALHGLNVRAVLLTHAHFDHIGGVDLVREAHQCPVYIHEHEAEWLTTPELNGSTRWSQVCLPMSMKPAEHVLRGGETLTIMSCVFQVIHTPGHSPGSVSFLHGSHLFAGDVLFRESIGRTDLRGGSLKTLLQSIREKLFPLGDDVHVYPGHGSKTTIGHEKQHNPFI